MSAGNWANRHARSVSFVLLALIVGGVIAARSMPVALFPHVNFPRIRFDLDAGDRPAERMEMQVTRPVELALRGIPGVRSVESTTNRGSAEVTLTFDWGQDMTGAYLQAQAEINRIIQVLPTGTTFEGRRMDPTVFPVIAYSLTSPTRSLSELHDVAQYRLLPVLAEITGVAKVIVDGGAADEYQIIISPDRLAERSITLGDVSSALANANLDSAVGRIVDRGKLNLIVVDAQLVSASDLGNVVLKASADGVTRISDIAQVCRVAAPSVTHATADGRDCVLLNVFQQPGGNTVQIAAGIRDALIGQSKNLPDDVAVTCWYDQSNLIESSAGGVRDAVAVGVALAGLVLLLFLRDWRITLVAALAVPAVLAITALVLSVFGESLNIMTLGGMAAAVGLVIDDVIVMAEHIVRRLHQKEVGSPVDVSGRVIRATDEFTRPLSGSSLSTIIIHIPPAFLVGVFGAFFAALSLSMAASLIVSFFFAWLVVPVLAARCLKSPKHTEPGRFARWIDRSYETILTLALRVPMVVLLVAAALFVAGYFAYGSVRSGVIPAIDEGGFVIDYVGPPGASIAEMDRLLGYVERNLQQMPEVQAYSRRTGFSLGGDISESNTGDFFVRLRSLPRRPIGEIMDEVRKRAAKEVPGLELEPAELMEDLLGDLTGKPQPIVVNLFGGDESALIDLAPKVAAAIGGVQGVSSVESGVVPAGDALSLHVDRVKVALEGVAPDALAAQLGDLMTGAIATHVQEGEKSVDVRVWTPKATRMNSDDLLKTEIHAPDGHRFELGRVATLDILQGQPEITRLDLQRTVAVTARSSRDLGDTIRDVRTVLDRRGLLPAGVRYTLGGQYQEQQADLRGTVRVASAAAVLVFLLLLFLYESLRVALAILLTTTLAIATVFIGMVITGTALNISSMMGMVMIVGNVTEVAIFYYSEFTSFATGNGERRLIDAGRQRIRAIAMTTIAAILALLPLALDWGHSAGMLQPLAVAIIAGLAVQLPLVLIVLPVFLNLCGVADNPGRPTAESSKMKIEA